MLQQKKPQSYIVATGKLHAVIDLVKIVFKYLDLDYKKYLKVSNKFFRVSETIPLCGDATKIRKIGWKPSKSFKDMLVEMIEKEKNKYES